MRLAVGMDWARAEAERQQASEEGERADSADTDCALAFHSAPSCLC